MRYIYIPAAIVAMAIALTNVQESESAPEAKGKPRCAIKNPPAPPLLLKGRIIARFENTCLDPVAQIGSYACLLEYDTEVSVPRILACEVFSRNRTRGKAEADVYASVICHYTTIPRYYAIDGYGWAIAYQGRSYTSPTVRSKPVAIFKKAAHGLPAVGWCHVSKKDLLEGWEGK